MRGDGWMDDEMRYDDVYLLVLLWIWIFDVGIFELGF
jgi:hypothetical protein